MLLSIGSVLACQFGKWRNSARTDLSANISIELMDTNKITDLHHHDDDQILNAVNTK